MEGLLEYNNDSLSCFLIDRESIVTKLNQYGITLVQKEFFNIDYFLEEVMYSHGYMEHNFYHGALPHTKKDAHEHGTEEARMIIRGTGRFYFLIDDIRLEIDVYPGDFLIIPPGITHYFNHKEPVLVLRLLNQQSE